jgi:hypothetical protein
VREQTAASDAVVLTDAEWSFLIAQTRLADVGLMRKCRRFAFCLSLLHESPTGKVGKDLAEEADAVVAALDARLAALPAATKETSPG